MAGVYLTVISDLGLITQIHQIQNSVSCVSWDSILITRLAVKTILWQCIILSNVISNIYERKAATLEHRSLCCHYSVFEEARESRAEHVSTSLELTSLLTSIKVTFILHGTLGLTCSDFLWGGLLTQRNNGFYIYTLKNKRNGSSVVA